MQAPSLFVVERERYDHMLNRSPSSLPTEAAGASSERREGFDIGYILGFTQRHWTVIAASVAVAIALAAIYIIVAAPLYSAKSTLLLDTRKLQLFEKQSVLGEVTFDTPAIESQIELLKSESVARAVVVDLNLASDPEFTGDVSSFFGSLWSAALRLLDPEHDDAAQLTAASSEGELARSAIIYLRRNLTVQRVRLTYVIEIGFRCRDQDKAIRVANAVAEAYITDQTQSKRFTTKRATAWLQERMTELREKAVNADRAAQDFRTKNNIIRVNGTSLDEQQLGQLTTQLVAAREQTAAAKARLDRIQEISASRVPDASMAAWLQNDVINRLRQQHVDLSRREADAVLRLGPEHEAVLNLRKEMRQTEQAASAELNRIQEGARNEHEVAYARETAMQARLDQQARENADSRQEVGTLQILESTAKAYQSLYDNFLQRYVEASQQQNFTNTEARVISAAERAEKVHPKPLLIVAIATMLGLMVGGGGALAREQLDKSLRKPKDVEDVLGVECLGILPAVEGKTISARAYDPSPAEIEERSIAHDLGLARQVLLQPFSRFTETVRRIKVAADTTAAAHEVQVLGLVSAVPGEGKSTVAANLAQLMAHSGARTLLIDGDLRNPSLTRTMAPFANKGLLEVLNDSCNLAAVAWRDPITGLDFIPVHLSAPIAHTGEIVASRAMADTVSQARKEYQYVVVDFPPLAPVVDAKAGSHIVDGFIMVIEWGQTSPEVIKECLDAAEVVQSKLIGAVLNMANSAVLKKIEAYKGKRYHKYYTT